MSSSIHYDEVSEKFRFNKIRSSDVVSRRSQFRLTTGQSEITNNSLIYTVNLQGKGMVNLRTLKVNTKLDISGAGLQANRKVWWPSSLHSAIKRLRITTVSGTVLVNISNYDVFMANIINKITHNYDGMKSNATVEGMYIYDNTAYPPIGDPSERRYEETLVKHDWVYNGVLFSLTPFCGLIDPDKDIFIPLEYLPLQLEIEFKPFSDWLFAVRTDANHEGEIDTAATGFATIGGAKLNYMGLTYDLYHMNESYNNSLRQKLSTSSLSIVFNTFTDHVASCASGNIRVASGYKNADAVMAVIQDTTSGALLSQSNGALLSEYQVRIGSDVYPEYPLVQTAQYKNIFLAMNAIYQDFDKHKTLMDIKSFATNDSIMYVNLMRDPDVPVTGQSLLSDTSDVYLVLEATNNASNSVYSFTKFTRVVSFDIAKNVKTYQ